LKYKEYIRMGFNTLFGKIWNLNDFENFKNNISAMNFIPRSLKCNGGLDKKKNT